MPPMELPPRDRGAEDAFVAAWSAAEALDGLDAVVEAALEARRPMLAARLCGLLPEEAAEDPALQRAFAAARLLLRVDREPDPLLVEGFYEEWKRARRAFMDRVRRRQRARAGQERPRGPRRR